MHIAPTLPAYFPLAPALLVEELRQPLLDFYGYIVQLQHICADSALPREEKRQQLRLLRLTLEEHDSELLPDWAVAYHVLLEQKRLSPVYGEMLWQGFWQDTEKARYATLAEVMSYARQVAAPIGRGALEIAGEREVDGGAVDALCLTQFLLQRLLHLRSDYLLHQRVYLPQHWLDEAGISEKVLTKKETGPKLRRVVNLWLEEAESQLQRAQSLPASLAGRSLRREIKRRLYISAELLRKCRRQDVLAERIGLTRLESATVSLLAAIF